MSEKLLPCPFCGADAEVQVEHEGFQIVGCSNRKNPASSLLCPNPSIVAYKDDRGEWDYKWWNRRTSTPPTYAQGQEEMRERAANIAKIGCHTSEEEAVKRYGANWREEAIRALPIKEGE